MSVVGLDIGERTTRLVEGRLKKGAFEILRAQSFPTRELAARQRELKLKGRGTILGVTGRDMILRITQVPTVPAWQLRDLMALEIEDIAEQSGDELSADFGLLSAAGDDEDRVLLALVRNSLIAERTELLASAGGKVLAFTPNAIALHNAVVATDGGEGTVLVAAVGGRNTDIALLRDGELLFARNLAGGGDLFTDAIADAFRLDADKAEQTKVSLGVFPGPGEKLAGQQGAIARVLEAPLRQVVGMLQSSMVLARSQLKLPDLEVERVLLAGPGASLPGFDAALAGALGLGVARFDPTDGYLVGGESVPAARGPDFAVAAGLALMGVLDKPYRIAILPEALRKRQHFRQRTLWLLLAAALVLGHLALAFAVARENTTAAARDLNQLRREVESRKAD
ncbi:MAG TPA: pilus assembly protein PilM, partial [Planctomycetota bacterium]|nr:pilus assembly protein PilM [Planctomycetota bacterium]